MKDLSSMATTDLVKTYAIFYHIVKCVDENPILMDVEKYNQINKYLDDILDEIKIRSDTRIVKI